MTDITTKLRSLSRWLRQLWTFEPEPECKASHAECADDCNEAADEIDRLRAEVADARSEICRLIDANGHQDEIIGEQAAQIARLREALAPFAEITPMDSGDIVGLMREDFAKARAALAPVEVGK